MKACAHRSLNWISSSLAMALMLPVLLAFAGCGGGGSFSTPPATPTVNIGASPTTIAAGSSSMLTVSSTNATSVMVTGSDGSSYTMSASGGTQKVSPSATTTYTAAATGSGGNASATTTVTVSSSGTPAPTVTIAASPSTIATGSTSTLTVVATNASSVKVTGSDGSSYTLAATGGTQKVTPSATTTYTAAATGAGGNASETAVVTVSATAPPAPTVTIAAKPATISAGNTSTLTVVATNATSVKVTGSDGSSYTLAAIGGTQTVNPATTTTYTATAIGAGGTVTATTMLTVTAAAAPTVTINAKPTSIIAGTSSTLMVTATNATTVTVTGSDGSSYTLSVTGGTQPVSPTTTTTYTATAIGAGGTVSQTATITVTPAPAPTVTIAANPTSITSGASSTLTLVATNATGVAVAGSDGTSFNTAATGGALTVSPNATTTYTATATGPGGTATATAKVTVSAGGSASAINHVVFMMQENHTFDNYFGMLNNYRRPIKWNIGDDGNTYDVDGIDDKLTTSNENDEGVSFPLFKFTSTCIDDDSSDWLASYGDINRYDFSTTRKIRMDGFVHTAEGYAMNCSESMVCSGDFSDTAGQRAMGYYDEEFLNYYYYMASQFAVSDRWFSPLTSKSNPNRIATMTGGTTQGLAYDPGYDDHVGALNIQSIFAKLDAAGVSWKVYYSGTAAECPGEDECGTGAGAFPATTLGYLVDSRKYLYINTTHAACTGTTQPSSVVGDTSNYFCIDPNHVAPLSYYFNDVASGNLPSFSYIEPKYGVSDEHPGSFQPVLVGQAAVASIVNAFMNSPSYADSVFFFSYDEGGGPYDHVPPVPGHSNDKTDAALGTIPDISSISVNPDIYPPCVPGTPPATEHCDLRTSSPGAHTGDAPQVEGFKAQLGFRLPNFVVSPFARRHYVSHIPMDHTAIMKFVEDRFIGDQHYLTARDAAQPNLLDFFDFSGVPWATPPTPPAPVTNATLGYNSCQPANMGP
jgi:phospholipase C